MRTALTSVTEEVLGYRDNKGREWMSADTWDVIEQRREIKFKLNDSRIRQRKAKLQAEYKERDREAKKGARRDRKRWISELAQKAEMVANNRNMRELYDVTRTLAKKRLNQSRPVKSKQGKLLTSEEDQMNRWREYFMEVLNREDTQEEK